MQSTVDAEGFFLTSCWVGSHARFVLCEVNFGTTICPLDFFMSLNACFQSLLLIRVFCSSRLDCQSVMTCYTYQITVLSIVYLFTCDRKHKTASNEFSHVLLYDDCVPTERTWNIMQQNMVWCIDCYVEISFSSISLSLPFVRGRELMSNVSKILYRQQGSMNRRKVCATQ